jgi:hypothetical protein
MEARDKGLADTFHLSVIEGSGKNTALTGDTPVPHRLVDHMTSIQPA